MSTDAATGRTTHRAMFYAGDHNNPERRILNMREQAEVRSVHTIETWQAGDHTHRAACSCGAAEWSSRSALTVREAASEHVGAMLENARAWKVATARANADRERIENAIELALHDGHRPSVRTLHAELRIVR